MIFIQIKQCVRKRTALERLENFENTLKAVIIENCEINFIYELVDKNFNFNIKMKSKISRYMALFKDKAQMIIFENNLNKIEDSEIETLATIEKNSWKDVPIILCKGLPYAADNEDDYNIFSKKILKNLK